MREKWGGRKSTKEVSVAGVISSNLRVFKKSVNKSSSKMHRYSRIIHDYFENSIRITQECVE